MRAVVVQEFGGLDNVVIDHTPDPVPQDGEVLVAIRATAVNFADAVTIAGKSQFAAKLPYIPGRCPVGVVRSVGAAVQNLQPGDPVIVLSESGGFAQLAAAHERDCVKIPARVPLGTAAAMASAFDTAWFALKVRANLAAGETLLVLGATGAVGVAAMQLGKVFGARVIAGISNSAKAQVALANGASGTVALTESLRDEVFALTDRRGADVVLDMLGGDAFDAAIRAVAWSGRLVSIGFASGRIPAVKVNYLLLKNIAVLGMQIGDYRRRQPDATAQCWHELFDLYASGKISPPPPAEWPLDRCRQALEAVQSRQAPGRIVLAPP